MNAVPNWPLFSRERDLTKILNRDFLRKRILSGAYVEDGTKKALGEENQEGGYLYCLNGRQ